MLGGNATIRKSTAIVNESEIIIDNWIDMIDVLLHAQ